MNEKNGIFIQVSTHVALRRVIKSVWNVAHPSPTEGKMSMFSHVNVTFHAKTYTNGFPLNG